MRKRLACALLALTLPHGVKIAHAPAEPLEDLPRAKTRLSQGGKFRLQFLRQEGEDIQFFGSFGHGVSNSPLEFRGKKAVGLVDIQNKVL